MIELRPDYLAIRIEEEDQSTFYVTERRLKPTSEVVYTGVNTGIDVGDKVMTSARGIEQEVDGELLKFIHKDDIIAVWRRST